MPNILCLDEVLSAQRPLSGLHDEMLFIVIHQTMELWMKEMLHEVDYAIRLIGEDSFAAAYKALSRVGRIQAVMTLSWDVLSTLTPVDYLPFRNVLGTSSGFQSAQFRELEFRLGLKDEAYLQTACAGVGRPPPARRGDGQAEPARCRFGGARARRLRCQRTAPRPAWLDRLSPRRRIVRALPIGGKVASTSTTRWPGGGTSMS